jgi:hypothetical protein
MRIVHVSGAPEIERWFPRARRLKKFSGFSDSSDTVAVGWLKGCSGVPAVVAL